MRSRIIQLVFEATFLAIQAATATELETNARAGRDKRRSRDRASERLGGGGGGRIGIRGRLLVETTGLVSVLRGAANEADARINRGCGEIKGGGGICDRVDKFDCIGDHIRLSNE